MPGILKVEEVFQTVKRAPIISISLNLLEEFVLQKAPSVLVLESGLGALEGFV